MTNPECPCGRARAGCEYHDPGLQPDPTPAHVTIGATQDAEWYQLTLRPGHVKIAGFPVDYVTRFEVKGKMFGLEFTASGPGSVKWQAIYFAASMPRAAHNPGFVPVEVDGKVLAGWLWCPKGGTYKLRGLLK